MRSRVWIVGTVSWDTVIYVDQYPSSGGFAQSTNRIERLGGSAANIAQGVASAGIETGLVSFLGDDELGHRIMDLLQHSAIAHLEIMEVPDRSSHALVVVDSSGERTVFALSPNYLSQLSLQDVAIQTQDIVVFALWRPVFKQNLEYANSLGCYTVVGLEALKDPQLPKANLAIGSSAELKPDTDIANYLDRFDRIVVTEGDDGSSLYSHQGKIHQAAIATDVVDTTGAGDTFISGFLAALARGDTAGNIGLQAGALWAASMVSQYRSIPPNSSEVSGLLKLLDSAKAE